MTDLISHEGENRTREITLEYLNFIDDSNGDKVYTQKCEELIRENGSRITINMNELRKTHPERADGLLRNFVPEILCLQQAVKDYIIKLDPECGKNYDFNIGFEGSFGNRHVNPRTLKAQFLGNMVCCEGIVTKCSTMRPKVVRSVHYCPATKKTFERRYTDLTSYEAFPSSNVYPTEDENKNPLETEYGLSTYRDHQTFSIQELPEDAPPGQLPRSVDVVADDDLADSCKPGDRVRVIGLYRCLPNKQNGYSSGNFRSIIIANNVQLMSKEMQPNFLPDDIKNIRKMSRQRGIFNTLARSLAPSIWGHQEVKKAILCLLLGGNEKVLENGSHIRGDINILLIGDPSVAKSQLLRYVLHTAPRAVATTGRGSSGVGLTAAVTTDIDTGERRLEAGAMVLADRGIVCIDEFDKMSDIDRTAIHEVMEQGRVTIAKAGIHAKLNARCSVLAAANPVFGRYNLLKTPMANIGMQDSLLSRFDLVFVLTDEHDPKQDKSIAEHILKLHQYRTPGEPDGTVLPMGATVKKLSTFDDEDEEETTKTKNIYVKNRDWCAVKKKEKLFTMEFVRKYIHMAKAMQPKLTKDASAYISECYTELRSSDTSRTDRERTMAVTVRQLETMIRLSTAIAKIRLARTVEKLDAKKAYQLLHYACFKEKPKERLELEEKRAKKRATGSGGDDDDDYDDDDDDDDDDGDGDDDGDDDEIDEEMEDLEDTTLAESTETQTTLRRTKRRGGDTQTSGIAHSEATTSRMDDDRMDTTTDDPMSSGPSAKRFRRETPSISIDRYKKFRKFLRKAFDDCGSPDDMVEISVIRNAIQEQTGRLPFSDAEFEAAFEQLTSENIAMIADDKITLI